MATESAVALDTERRSGDVIAGRYRLRRQLGTGGMGVVWLARSLALDVDVALKMLRVELIGAEAVERLAREARTAAQLGHPALVRVHDYGKTERGEPFLAMELLEGEDLAAQLQRERYLAPERAVALLLPIVDGLGVAHERGVVHRDLKPANIFVAVDAQGRTQPKLLDFGIAKHDATATSRRLTLAGDVLGSPLYLSPEQAEGLDDVDHRVDIWSLGVVLYEAVTGVTPFQASNYNALIRCIARDAPTPITDLGKGDTRLWLIIERCLRKDPAERWATMWEVGGALASWAFERGVQVDAAARSIRHDWLDAGRGSSQRRSSWLPEPASGIVTATPRRELEPPPQAKRLRVLFPAVLAVAMAGAGLLILQRLQSFRAVPEERAQAAVSSIVAVASIVAGSSVPPPSAATAALRLPPATAAQAGSRVAPHEVATPTAGSARRKSSGKHGKAAPASSRPEFGF